MSDYQETSPLIGHDGEWWTVRLHDPEDMPQARYWIAGRIRGLSPDLCGSRMTVQLSRDPETVVDIQISEWSNGLSLFSSIGKPRTLQAASIK